MFACVGFKLNTEDFSNSGPKHLRLTETERNKNRRIPSERKKSSFVLPNAEVYGHERVSLFHSLHVLTGVMRLSVRNVCVFVLNVNNILYSLKFIIFFISFSISLFVRRSMQWQGNRKFLAKSGRSFACRERAVKSIFVLSSSCCVFEQQ